MNTHHSDTGSSTLELGALAAGLLLVVTLIIGIGRIQIASHSVEEAARAAAREASIARTSAEARIEATGAASTRLSEQGLTCQGLNVDVDLSDFTKAPGSRGAVNAHVECVVSLDDVLLPALPGQVPVSAQIDSPIDTYREMPR